MFTNVHRSHFATGGGGSGDDRISSLPDALLHEILVRLRSADAAARTSVLSRRWRYVWAHLPKLHLVAPPAAAPASFPATVDAALGGYLAPTLEHLGVSHHTDLQRCDLRIPAGRIASWLRFAAERVVGELKSLSLCASDVRRFDTGSRQGGGGARASGM